MALDLAVALAFALAFLSVILRRESAFALAFALALALALALAFALAFLSVIPSGNPLLLLLLPLPLLFFLSFSAENLLLLLPLHPGGSPQSRDHSKPIQGCPRACPRAERSPPRSLGAGEAEGPGHPQQIRIALRSGPPSLFTRQSPLALSSPQLFRDFFPSL